MEKGTVQRRTVGGPHEAVLSARVQEELCFDLARRHTIGIPSENERDAARLNYERIASILYCRRPKALSEAERKNSAEKLDAYLNYVGPEDQRKSKYVAWVRSSRSHSHFEPKVKRLLKRLKLYGKLRFFEVMDKAICRYLVARLNGESWVTSGLPLMHLLALERTRDRARLRSFLEAIFDRWKKIAEPNSTHRQSVIIHQILGSQNLRDKGIGMKEVPTVLERVGVAKAGQTAVQLYGALRTRESRERSDAQTAAVSAERERAVTIAQRVAAIKQRYRKVIDADKAEGAPRKWLEKLRRACRCRWRAVVKASARRHPLPVTIR